MILESLFWYVFIISGALYAIILLMITIGWCSLKNDLPNTKALQSTISVILPVRNEERNILNCLRSILSQNFPLERFEVLIINDYSTDNTLSVVEKFINGSKGVNISLINKENEKPGKKATIALGIERSKGDIIITTDADCIMGENWLSSIFAAFKLSDPDMVIGPVGIIQSGGVFNNLQSLENLSLTGVTGGTAALNNPVMASGANLAFKKSAYLEAGGYQKGMNYASGDDMFFLQQLKMKKKKILFLKDYNACVFTHPQNSISGFFNQRMRWAGKAGAYTDISTVLVAMLVFVVNILLVSGIVFLAAGHTYTLFPLVLLSGIKFVVDFPLIALVSGFYKSKRLLFFYPLIFILYPFYVMVSSLGGLIFKQNWKN